MCLLNNRAVSAEKGSLPEGWKAVPILPVPHRPAGGVLVLSLPILPVLPAKGASPCRAFHCSP